MKCFYCGKELPLVGQDFYLYVEDKVFPAQQNPACPTCSKKKGKKVVRMKKVK